MSENETATLLLPPSASADLVCPVRTSTCVSADEAEGVIKAFKLGRTKRSYNSVELLLERRGEPGRAAEVVHVAETPGVCGGVELEPGLGASVLHFSVTLAGDVAVCAAVYLVYAEPIGVEQSTSRLPPIALPSSSAPSATASYSWRCVSRAHCGKGCDPVSPLLSAPLRLAAAAAGSAGRPAKDGRRLYVAIDEPSHHVATSQADAPRFRLLVACWALGRGRSAGALLSSAVSRPIRVVANNDAPGGAASFCVSLAMPADWDGLQPLVPAPLQAPASERDLKRTCRELRPALQELSPNLHQASAPATLLLSLAAAQAAQRADEAAARRPRDAAAAQQSDWPASPHHLLPVDIPAEADGDCATPTATAGAQVLQALGTGQRTRAELPQPRLLFASPSPLRRPSPAQPASGKTRPQASHLLSPPPPLPVIATVRRRRSTRAST